MEEVLFYPKYAGLVVRCELGDNTLRLPSEEGIMLVESKTVL